MVDGNETGFDGLGIARQRIAEEARLQTGTLDLGRLGLTDLPAELFALRHLRGLCLGEGFRRVDGEWQNAGANGPPNHMDHALQRLGTLPELRELSLAGTDLDDLSALAGLRNLQAVDCARTQVSDLSPLAALSGLQRLDCSGTQATDLVPLARLTGLQMLYLSYVPVSDLSPLAGLTALQHLDCSSTDTTDLAPLAGLGGLRVLDCSYTQVSDLAPLAGLVGLQRILFAGTAVEDLAPLSRIAALRWCDCSHAPVTDLSPLAALTGVQRVLCSGTQITDLAPLANMTTLRVLFCADTRVSSLQPLTKLEGLRGLDCSNTDITDLRPLAALTGLQILHCSHTRVADLTPLTRLTALQVLYCSTTPIRSLAPLKELTALQVLSCANTEITDLAALQRLTVLRELSCAGTKVTTLAPLTSSPALQWLSCSDTQVAELAPVAGMRALLWFSCAGSRVIDLSPLSSVTSLQWLDCSECRLRAIPETVWGMPTLRELHLFRSTVDQVPPEVLSQSKRDNCLASLRAHYADLAEGAEAVPDVKLVIMGNGRVGKTQLSRKLRNEEFQHHWDSTHGIAVRPGELTDASGTSAARLQIWDFGGQDIYQGTHALFLRTRAVFVLAWAMDVETTKEYEHQGITFQNHPLSYWLEYIRQFGDKDSPVLILQTKCDAPDDDVDELPVSDTDLAQFGYLRVLKYSSANDRGRAELDAALYDAITWMRQPERQGGVMTGAGRVRVRRRLEALRDSDAPLAPAARQYRTLDREAFLRICAEEGGVGSTEQLLSYLNNAGAVFYRRGLFHDRIVLDQAWALDAIYAVFQRDKCYKQIQRRNGRFTRKHLEELVWREYGVAEQRLFLSMMLSCGICFVHTPGSGPDDDAVEYIAPDLLPDRRSVEAELDRRWNDSRQSETETFAYNLLPPGLLRSVIARIGGMAGTNGLYWRDGLHVYETTLRAHGLIEQIEDGDFGGTIRVRTQGRSAASLVARLSTWIEEEQARAGLDPDDVTRTSSGTAGREEEPFGILASLMEPSLMFGRSPANVPAR